MNTTTIIFNTLTTSSPLVGFIVSLVMAMRFVFYPYSRTSSSRQGAARMAATVLALSSFVVPVVAVPAVIWASVWLFDAFNPVRCVVPGSSNLMAAVLMSGMEDEDEEEDLGVESGTERGRTRCVRLAVAHVRANLGGLPRRTEANRLVVGRLVSAFLTERGVRPTHQLRIAPIAVAASFIPTDTDIVARQIDASVSAASRRLMEGAEWGSEAPDAYGQHEFRVAPKFC